ncbi:GTP 3',8-cyclase MoaA [Alcanivorax sp. IL3]|uniref:GTP 3',8-cyclase MoaA n=1 Tax=unclassified Alcanivorax TaxID=2638842 RepID=UPI0039C31943
MSDSLQTPLVDSHGRSITYLRLSITDRCDFRCVYCMSEDMTFLPRSQVMDVDEIVAVAAACVRQGVTRIRLTGGEPLIHPDLLTLVARIKALPGLQELALTTNGSRLAALAGPLKRAGLDRLNISLDSLDPDRFRRLTRVGKLERVLAGIEAAHAAGFARIKLNAVILRGRNDDEIIDLVRFARARKLDLAFIEEMPLGDIVEHDRRLSFMPSDEVLGRIEEHFALQRSVENTGGPARYYRMANSAIRIGVISPHSNNFCASCNRIRVTASGRLLLCLGNEHGVELRPHLQAGKPLDEVLHDAMKRKPQQHHFYQPSDTTLVRFMNMTGG